MLGSVSKFFSKVVGNKSDRDIKAIMPLVENIKSEYSKLENISNDQLRAKTIDFKTKIKASYLDENAEIAKIKEEIDTLEDVDKKEDLYKQIDEIEKTIIEKIEATLMEILPEAFAVVKETARRFSENEKVEVTANDMDKDFAAQKDSVEIIGNNAYYHNVWMAAGGEVKWNMIHYDVQLIGGIVLHQGKIAEMATGEGKTLVATLPVYLNALAERGVHLVTVNDYLARRDSEWMGPIFEFHGMTIDCIDKHQPNSEERRKAYLADITYGTNNEFGFDYLRDNMSRSSEDLVQRKHHYAIIDEVDSVLIDDARTPLIISGPTPKGDIHEFSELKPRVEKLVSAQRRLITTLLADAKKKFHSEDQAQGKEAKKLEEAASMALLRSYRGFPKNKALIKFLSEPGIRAKLQKTENYYLQDQGKEMHIVDEALYFTIDEKNNTIELTERGLDLISESGDDKSFFILPDINLSIADLEKQAIR